MPAKTELVCKSCYSSAKRSFDSEIAIHFPGINGLQKPIVWVFPKLLVCLDCGSTEFTIEETELQVLRHGSAVEGAIIYDRKLNAVVSHDGQALFGTRESTTVHKDAPRKSATDEQVAPQDGIDGDH